ncbi:uncharacterized protein V6R79_012203 [Siganus canaliculatus]
MLSIPGCSTTSATSRQQLQLQQLQQQQGPRPDSSGTFSKTRKTQTPAAHVHVTCSPHARQDLRGSEHPAEAGVQFSHQPRRRTASCRPLPDVSANIVLHVKTLDRNTPMDVFFWFVFSFFFWFVFSKENYIERKRKIFYL